MADTIPLPILDYAKSLEDQKYGSETIFKAFKEPGFLFIKNIPGLQYEKLLEWTKWFFEDLPKEERDLLKTMGTCYRGFIEAKEGAASSYKHLLEIGPYNEPRKNEFVLLDANKWPKSNPNFKDFMSSHYELCTNVSKHVIVMLGSAVGANEADWLKKLFPSNMSTLRLIKYPKRNGETPDALLDGKIALTCQSHQDTGVLTLLPIFDQPGLQIVHDNQYRNVEAKEPGFVVNIGKILVAMCGHGIKATEHRVLDIGRDRYTVPFFLEPRYEAEIEAELNGSVGRFTYGKYCIERLKVFFEHQEFASKLMELGY